MKGTTVKQVFVRAPYNYDQDKVSDETGLKCLDKSRTQQSFAEEADINTIVNRFLKTGALPDNVRVPQYGDFEGIFDFHTAMNAVRLAQEQFDELPAQIRARFHNDPQELLQFIGDEDNRQEAEKLGLVPPRAAVRDPGDTQTADLPLGGPTKAPEAPAAPQTPQGGPAKGGTT